MYEFRFKLRTYTVKRKMKHDFVCDSAVTGAHEAVPVILSVFESLDQDRENLVIFCLNADGRVTDFKTASIGTGTTCLVEQRAIFQAAIVCGAEGIFVAHNHPSGSLNPSDQDVEMAVRLHFGGAMLGIPVHDQFIVGVGEDGLSAVRRIPLPPAEDVIGFFERLLKGDE